MALTNRRIYLLTLCNCMQLFAIELGKAFEITVVEILFYSMRRQ
jgi:hypothetical protein